MISSLQNEGIDDLWDLIQDFKVMIFLPLDENKHIDINDLRIFINFEVKVNSRRIVI